MKISQTAAINNRVLAIDGVINFRDLGGYQTQDGQEVKWGQVYRSAQFDKVSEQGVIDMAALGIKTVVDLRFSEETERYPTIVAAVPGAEILSWHDETQKEPTDEQRHRSSKIKFSWADSLNSNDPAQVREAMRVNYPEKLYSHKTIYRKMLLRLMEGKSPLVFHCAAGKDRTGVAAALILSLLGVSDDVIIEDYLITQQEVSGLLDRWIAGGAGDDSDYQDVQSQLRKHPKEVVQPIFDADINYIKTLLDYVAATYGGFANYARSTLGLSNLDLQKLKSALLT